ncbi:Uncharacterised protein [Mycobacteroides abscessus subsp. massiliense]|nr:Uncharacterised protein [Mycobacteroides abscessus subsp. massiliense]
MRAQTTAVRIADPVARIADVDDLAALVVPDRQVQIHAGDLPVLRVPDQYDCGNTLFEIRRQRVVEGEPRPVRAEQHVHDGSTL